MEKPLCVLCEEEETREGSSFVLMGGIISPGEQPEGMYRLMRIAEVFPWRVVHRLCTFMPSLDIVLAQRPRYYKF